MPRRVHVFIGAAALCLGCASPLGAARVSYDAARSVYDAGLHRYRVEQEACLDLQVPDPCVARVRARWAPVRGAADALRSALVALGASISLYDTLGGTGRAPSPEEVQKRVLEALGAAEALVRAEQEAGTP